MSQSGQPARKAALALTSGVLVDQRLLGELVLNLPELKHLGPSDKARARRLATETLRWMDRADRILGRYLRKMPPVQVMNILRLSVVEICHLEEAPHGVVHDAVTLVKTAGISGKFSGLVNATLRKVAVEGPDRWHELPPPQTPKWLRKPLISTYGKSTVVQIEKAHSQGAPVDLTPKDGNAENLAAKTGGIALPSGSVRLCDPGQISELPGYATGEWWVQDAAAAIPVQLLKPQPGESVLDLCAAPGGKTMQLSAAGTRVVALDHSLDRLKRVHENLERTNLPAIVLHASAIEHEGSYDAVLLDAPCSATGTVRRHPDLPHLKSFAGVGELIALQAQMLSHARHLVRPGGRLLFCTCSLLPEEGEDQIAAFLNENQDWHVVPPDLPWLDQHWQCPNGGVRLRPDYWEEIGGMDGFYMACLRKS